MNFERTKDTELIRRICTHAKIFPASSDDLSPSPAEWQPVEHDAIWYVLVKSEKTLLGLFPLFPQNSICWEAHLCLLPACYGKTTEAVEGMFRWVFSNTQCLRIVGSVPVYNTLAIRLAERSGMKRYGVNTKSRLKNGVLYDQVLFGISRSEIWA